MRLSICARGTLLHLCAVTIAIIVLSVIRWAVPSLSGIHKVFPSNVSEHLSVNEFNAWRTEQANGVIARFSNLLLQNSHGTEAESAVNVVIVASGREGYFLTQVVAALLELQNTSTLDAAISICDVSETANDEIDRISQIVPRIKIRSPYLHDYGSYEGRIAKESNDYWLCMNATHNSRYLLLIEDDAVPVPAFGHLLHSIVQRMDSDQKIDFIKLYHPGYLRKLPYYFQVSLTSLLISLLLTVSVWRTVRWLPFMLTFAFFVYHFDVHYTYQLFADLRYALTGSAYVGISESCCTPAVIYRSSSIPNMLDYFTLQTHNNRSAKDDLLDESPFTSRLTDTNFVIHIGYVSVIRGKIVTLDAIRQLQKQSEHVFPF